MAFIDTSSTIIGVEINQIDARYVAPGQEVEVTFKFAPGRIYSGKVESILQAIATGQAQTSGTAVMPKAIEAAPFVVRVKLDDADSRKACRPGARHGGHLHRACQADAHHPARNPASDRDPELCQSVLTYFRCRGPRGVGGFSGAAGVKLKVAMNVEFVGRFSV